ncbi:FKBP-type peptidyl-prolyl cis-trans isomerase [Sphingomonas sp. So64.6b]|uniref:FKBP-type peptidyl-prolyl cis-trans isomerase n=1 Tax=Sphingomonas sp. So64.6b TaxID=2997354 RepID=UPI00160495E7|nr:FKBP-type peptidyl-prolyl cis-trans isomerase [Sphingomonas sp. So64.6b]QNA86398.1 FKBP-type peptidyl-prolyl cis-trans isomerase [Sphingomonas sp. So64.6b]
MPANLWLIALAAMSAQQAPARPDDAAAVSYANVQQLALAQRGPAQGWQVTASGLHWRRVKGDGAGVHPGPDDEVTAHYAGTFVDGATFDSSYARAEPITFRLGQVIPGWREALPLAGIGDVLEIAVPWTLAYGPRGKGPIPGGATLLFTVELIAVNGTPAAP